MTASRPTRLPIWPSIFGTNMKIKVIAAETEAERRLAHGQALASARIEGFVPSPEFKNDCEAVIAGTMTRDEARARSLERALARDRAIAEESAQPHVL